MPLKKQYFISFLCRFEKKDFKYLKALALRKKISIAALIRLLVNNCFKNDL